MKRTPLEWLVIGAMVLMFVAVVMFLYAPLFFG